MPFGPRIRANNVYGVISDNPLTPGSATFNSVSLPLLPPVVSAHAVVVFDPKRVFGDPEIVVVTVHTAGATVATILRGQYGTSTREHPQGTAWAHVPVDEDWTEILTSTTRPLDPYAGQLIYETNTSRYVARNAANTIWERQAWTAVAGRTGCSLRRVANQLATSAVTLTIAWDTEDFDSDGFFAPTSTTITVPAGLGGLYAISARHHWAAQTGLTTRAFTEITTTTAGYRMSTINEDNIGFGVVVPLVAGATVTYSTFYSSGGTLNVDLGVFTMYRIGI